MEATSSPNRSTRAAAPTRGYWLLAAACLLLFHAAWLWQGDAARFWLPGLGMGIVYLCWFGWRILPVLAFDLLLVRLVVRWQMDWSPWLIAADATLFAALYAAQIWLSWWLYHHVANGSLGLDDPRSATVFLILVPGGVSALAAAVEAGLWTVLTEADAPFFRRAAELWLSRVAGILVVAPFLIVAVTPLLLRRQLLDDDWPRAVPGDGDGDVSWLGDRIELAGLTFATAVLALLVLWTHARQNITTAWLLWPACLVLIVWTCIRQGLRGGCFSAGVTSFVVVAAAQVLDPGQRITPVTVQGNLLAFCSTALLVGVSASWIRANETRYRQVVCRIPFVLYSVRLPYGMPAQREADHERREARMDLRVGPSICKLANVVLVSPAAKQVFGCDAESLMGPFTHWLKRILAEDHELVIASLTQLCLQKQPVTCEYRLCESQPASSPSAPAGRPIPPAYRWLRDTLTPHYSDEGTMDGWEGLVEDITENRAMSQNLRKTTTMLQALVSNLPTGVYFVQAPHGTPILVNARARQLLGQRENLSAGLENLSRIYRLHRADGSEYPWQELPVAKALRQGAACRANDIVLHRADGRKIPLITWAAPLDLNHTGAPDAAIWVLEDWSMMHQAESALRDSELRLRAVIETMVEGVIVENADGVVIDGNAAACAILGVSRQQLLGRIGLAADLDCVQEDRSAMSRERQPDHEALRHGQPMRNVIVGLPGGAPGEFRWLLVNALPLPVGPIVGLNPQRARVVTTFADITPQVQAQESLRVTLERYQSLIDTLPFMLLQRDRDLNITYLNPAATQLTGHTVAEMMRPSFFESIMHPDDRSAFAAAARAVGEGKSTRIEARFRAKDDSLKSVLVFFHPNRQDGEVVGSTSLLIDITMQRRLEEELQQAKHLELVARLASGTVHDFNNLVTVLMGLAGLSKMLLPEQHPAWQNLVKIEEVGEQAAHLAGQILTFSKQRPKQIRPVDLNALVVQTLKLARGVLSAEIEVRTKLAALAPMAAGDDNPLKQVLMNLFLNAGEAMPSGGTLSVRTDLTPPPPTARDHATKQWVHLAVEDTGTGMDESVRSRVFEPFFSTKELGTGLGMAVVQQIITDLGGIIEVWSEPGTGTRFDIWLEQATASVHGRLSACLAPGERNGASGFSPAPGKR